VRADPESASHKRIRLASNLLTAHDTITVIETIGSFLQGIPVLCLLLSILLGTVIGGVHIKGVGLGAVVGTLLAGLVIGIVARPELPEQMRWLFFYLFLFSIGYSVGPQLFAGSLRQTLPQIALALTIAASGLASVLAVVGFFGFDEGLAVGIFSGGLTQSAALGTGISAINELPISEDAKVALINNAPLGDAITYGFGDLGLIVFLTWLGPKLLRMDLKRDAKAMERTLEGGGNDTGVFRGTNYAFRALRIENAAVAGRTVAELEESTAAVRLAVQRVRRGEQVLGLEPSLRLQIGDELAVSARRGVFSDVDRSIGPEIDAPELLAVPMQASSIVVTSRQIAACTLAELAGSAQLRGVYLESLQRGTVRLPREPGVRVQRGDILHVVGAPDDVERAGALIGFVERDLSRTDLAFLAGGICCGILLALAKVSIGGVSIGLGAAGSILLVGVLGGWFRSRYPVFGSIPEPAQRLLMDLGLTVFVALIGLKAGPHAVEAYHEKGGVFFAQIFFSGAIVTMVPLLVGTLVGRRIFRLSPIMLLGGLAGAQTCPPGLAALREASESDVVSLGYAVPYAIGSVLLTICGPVVVAIVHAMRH
jgi:putative transport protein